MFERSRPSYKPNWRNWLAPQAPENFGAPFKGAGRTGHPICLYSKCSVFSGHFPSLGPQEGSICAATSDFVATLIMGTNVGRCRLLLVEDPALKAQPWHEVAVGVFGPALPPPSPFKGPKCLGGVGVMDCTWAPPMRLSAIYAS